MAEIEALAQALDPGDFAQFLAKLALYKRGDPAPLSAADLAACAPPAAEAEIDALVALAADGDAAALATALQRRRRPLGQPDRRSPSPPAATSAPCTPRPAPRDGADAALARARPPVFGPRRARMAAQARALGARRAREGPRPHHRGRARAPLAAPAARPALAERLLLRLATLKRRAA